MSEAAHITAERQRTRTELDAQIGEAEANRAAAGQAAAPAHRAGDISTTRIRTRTVGDAPIPAPQPFRPTWPTSPTESTLSPEAAAYLRAMRHEVTSQNKYRQRILDRANKKHPRATTEFDEPLSPAAARAVADVEARLAAIESAAPGLPAGDPLPNNHVAPASPAAEAAPDRSVQPAVLHRIRTVVHAQVMEAYDAQERLHARVGLIARGSAQLAARGIADRVVAALDAPGINSPKEAGENALAALGPRGFLREREEIAALAGEAWEARRMLSRLNGRAAEVLEMNRLSPTSRFTQRQRQHASDPESPYAAPVPTDAEEILREVERRRAQLVRDGLEERGLTDPTVLPIGEPRMQKGGAYQDVRSIDCLRCGTTIGREDRRSNLNMDGTAKRAPDGTPERSAPGNGKRCTPCWLNGAPMSVGELKLAQRQARLIEPAQVRYRPGRAGWDERADEWSAREQARRGLVTPIEERLDAPTPWVVQATPAEVADRRLEDLIERTARREEALEMGQWDAPGDREGYWWDLKFPGIASGEPEQRADLSPERRLQLETERLAEARRRLLSVVGVEDPALRRALETQAAVRLHLAQGGAIRHAWEQTLAIPRAELRAVARNEIENRYMAPEVLAHHRRLREARGIALPRGMSPELQAAIRARQVERILADLDVPTLVRRVEAIARTAVQPATKQAAHALLQELEPALEDTRLQGALGSGQLAETARQERPLFHSGVDEAVLPGERRAEVHERAIDRWLQRLDEAEALGADDIWSARELARRVGELNPRRDVKEYTPEEGSLPWQLLDRDAKIAAEVEGTGLSSPDRVLAALEQYKKDVTARGPEVGDPFGQELRERITEAAARQSGFTQPEIDRLWELHALTAGAQDPHAFDELMRETGAWMEDPAHNNDPERLRTALEVRTERGAPLTLQLTQDDLRLMARAQQAAAPYLAVIDGYRVEWFDREVPALLQQEQATLAEHALHPAVKEAAAHADPRVAEVLAQTVALREFERIDPAYQAAMRQIEHAESVLDATRESREAAQRAWTDAEKTLKAQFTNPEKLLERVHAMETADVTRLATALRTDPLTLSANHPRKTPPRIPGVNAGGEAERLEPYLKTVRARGLRSLRGDIDKSATERQARVAAVALETWAEARQRSENVRTWAVSQLGMQAGTATLAEVSEAAMHRLAALKEKHQELIGSWQQLSPAPTRAQIERRIATMDPATAGVARTAITELNERPAAAGPVIEARPERNFAQPALAR
jgi:hypothetical protein